MRLKWLPVRLRRGRRVRRLRGCSPRRSPGGPPTDLHFCGEPANGGGSRPKRAPFGEVAPRSRGELTARRLDVPGPTEESCESPRTCSAGPPPRREAGPLPSAVRPRWSLRAVARRRSRAAGGRPVAPCAAVVGARMAASDPS